jgi:hypothetical protein
MLSGYWLPESELQEMLSRLKVSFIPSNAERLSPAGLLLVGLWFLHLSKKNFDE